MEMTEKEYNKYKARTIRKMGRYSAKQLEQCKAYYFYNKQYFNPTIDKLDKINEELDKLKPARPKKGRPKSIRTEDIIKVKELRKEGKRAKQIAKELNLNYNYVHYIIWGYLKKRKYRGV